MKIEIKHHSDHAFTIACIAEITEEDENFPGMVADIAQCIDDYYGDDRVWVEHDEEYDRDDGYVSVSWGSAFKRIPSDSELLYLVERWNAEYPVLHIDNELKGHIYAYYWEPVKEQYDIKHVYYTDRRAFNKGYAKGWQARGKDDAVNGQKRMRKFPDDRAKDNYAIGWKAGKGK